MSDERFIPRNTGEEIMGSLLGTEVEAVGGVMQSGRRKVDWSAFFTPAAQVSIFFWVFGCFLEEKHGKHKPSMSRIMLAFWTWVGWKMVQHELGLVVGQGVPLANAAWTAWWAAEGVLTLAVFGPQVASYFGPGAAGAVAATAIGSAVRDVAPLARRLLAKEAGHAGTEYDDSDK